MSDLTESDGSSTASSAKGREGLGPRGPRIFAESLATLALVLAIGVLVVVAALPLVWRDSVWITWGAVLSALLLGVGAMATVLRMARQSRANARALAEFASHLRAGDVSGALRAVRAESPRAISAWGGLDSASAHDAASEPPQATAPISRFDHHAREVELAMGERERRWQARMRLSADWHWETDESLRLTWVSQDLASLVKLGVQPQDLVGHELHEVPLFQPPAEGWAVVVGRMRERKPLRELTLEVLRRGRSPVWVTISGRPHFDDDGRFTGYEGVGRDVTDARLAYQRLADSEKRHGMMAELAADWFWQTDAEHRFTEVGPVGRQMAGDRADRLLGHRRWEVYADGASDAEWAAHRADLEARRSYRGFEFAIRQGDRGVRWVSIGGEPRFDDQGEFLGYHGVGRDITLKKRAERLLLTRNEQLERLVADRTAELEQSNRDLEAFSRQLAHELRTPIGQVAGLSDLIKSQAWGRLTPEEREWLRLSSQAAREMSLTVTALLELARSTSAALLLEPVDLSAQAESVVADLPWIERKAPVHWVIEPGLVARCSAALARVVLTNLLGNAAKFTRDVTAPRVEFGREPDGSFYVQDNGAGFDAARAATLFQPFVRLHRSEQYQGTGLGLSIVRRIVERHGGHVTARGEPGRGARFSFRLGALREAELPPASESVRDVVA